MYNCDNGTYLKTYLFRGLVQWAISDISTACMKLYNFAELIRLTRERYRGHLQATVADYLRPGSKLGAVNVSLSVFSRSNSSISHDMPSYVRKKCYSPNPSWQSNLGVEVGSFSIEHKPSGYILFQVKLLDSYFGDGRAYIMGPDQDCWYLYTLLPLEGMSNTWENLYSKSVTYIEQTRLCT